MRTFVWGDIESSGLGKNAGVVEVAWIETDEHFNIISKQSSLINPEVPIEFGAMGVHGITDAMVANAPTMTRFMTELGFPLAGDKVLCCHNVSFDQRFFGPWMDEPLQTLCTLKCSRVLYPDAENHKLSTLRCMFNLKGEAHKAHSAMEDVHVLIQLAANMCAEFGLSMPELLDVQNRPRKIKVISFGKHKGSLLSDLPNDYVNWLLTKADNVDTDLRASLESL